MEDISIISIPFLLILALLIFKFPEFGIVLCLVVGAFFKGIIQPYLGPLDITIYLFAITFGVILIRCSIEKKLVVPDLRMNSALLLFIATFLFSLTYSPLFEQGVEIFLRFVLLAASLMYAIVLWCTDQKRIRRLLFTLIWVVLGYSAFLFVWVLILKNHIPTDTRAILSDTPAISIAQILAATIPLAVILNGLIKSKQLRLTLILLIIIGIVQLIALNTRGPLIAFFVGVVFLAMGRLKKGGPKLFSVIIAVFLLIALAFVLLPAQYTDRFKYALDFTSSSWAARIDMWKFVGSHFAEWFVKGAGMFGFAYYYYEGRSGLSIYHAYPHNIYLDIFASAGIFSLLIFLYLVFSFLHKGFNASMKAERPFSSMSLGSVTALTIILLAGVFSMSIIGTRTVWFFGGVILVIWYASKRTAGKLNVGTDIE